MTAETIRTKRVQVKAGKSEDLNEPGNSVHIVTLPVAGSRVKVSTNNGDVVELTEGRGTTFPQAYKKLQIENLAGADQLVELSTGFGEFKDKAVAGTVQVEPASSWQTFEDQVVLDGTEAVILAANANRHAATIRLTLSSAAVSARLGPAAAEVSATRGIEIQQGMVETITHEGAVWLHAPAGGGAVTVSVSEEIK